MPINSVRHLKAGFPTGIVRSGLVSKLVGSFWRLRAEKSRNSLFQTLINVRPRRNCVVSGDSTAVDSYGPEQASVLRNTSWHQMAPRDGRTANTRQLAMFQTLIYVGPIQTCDYSIQWSARWPAMLDSGCMRTGLHMPPNGTTRPLTRRKRHLPPLFPATYMRLYANTGLARFRSSLKEAESSFQTQSEGCASPSNGLVCLISGKPSRLSRFGPLLIWGEIRLCEKCGDRSPQVRKADNLKASYAKASAVFFNDVCDASHSGDPFSPALLKSVQEEQGG
jgi:hypothetical protein